MTWSARPSTDGEIVKPSAWGKTWLDASSRATDLHWPTWARRTVSAFPRGHLRRRRQGDPLLQGLRLRRDDRVDRPSRQEAGAAKPVQRVATGQYL